MDATGARVLLGASGSFNPPPPANASLEQRVTNLETAFRTTGTGDAAWMLTATSLVILMTVPGLAMFYGGLVQPKNYLHTVMQSFFTCCLVTCTWMIFGYSLAFTPGSPVIGGASRFFLYGMLPSSVHPLAPAIPESLFMTFQMAFAIITPALICGGLAERMRFSAFIIFISAWSLLVYCPVAHSVWAIDGFLSHAGFLDFAGGTVVHVNSGVAALVAALMLGRRTGFGDPEAFRPHNVSTSLVGASLLWVGWFGFNAGSALGAGVNSSYAMAVTQIATGAAALSWMFTEWLVKGRPTVLSVISGAVAGLVVITPACGYVDMTGAIVMGFVGGILCFFSVQLKHRLSYDDALDAWGVHGVGGILGSLMTGLFARPGPNGPAGTRVGAFYGNGRQLAVQLYGCVVVAAYSAFATYAILRAQQLFMRIRVSAEHEEHGLDFALHGEAVIYIHDGHVEPLGGVDDSVTGGLLGAPRDSLAYTDTMEDDAPPDEAARARAEESVKMRLVGLGGSAHGGGEGGDGSEGRVRRGKVHPAAGDDGDGIAMGVLGALARGEAAPLVGE